jgi:diguanylate cyclase (GGDEF)-like protein
VAVALQGQIRLTDLLVRMGGDEFLPILRDTDIQAACHLAERLCRVVTNLGVVTNASPLGVSIGLAEWRPGAGGAQLITCHHSCPIRNPPPLAAV